MLGHTYRLLERVFKHHKMLEHNMASQGLPGYVTCGEGFAARLIRSQGYYMAV